MNDHIANVHAILGPGTSPADAWRFYKQRYATRMTAPQFYAEWAKAGQPTNPMAALTDTPPAPVPDAMGKLPSPLKTPAVIPPALVPDAMGKLPNVMGKATLGPTTALTNTNAYPNTAPNTQPTLKHRYTGGMPPQANGLSPGIKSTEVSQGQAPLGDTYGAPPPQAVPPAPPQAVPPAPPPPGAPLTTAAEQQALDMLTAPAGMTPEEQRMAYERATQPFLEQFNPLLERLRIEAEMKGQFYGGALPTAQGNALSDLSRTLSGVGTDIELWNARNREDIRQQRMQQALDVAGQRRLEAGQYGYEGTPGSMALAGRRMSLEEELGQAGIDIEERRLGLQTELGRAGVTLDTRQQIFAEEMGRADLKNEQNRIDIIRDAQALSAELGRGDLVLQKRIQSFAEKVAKWNQLNEHERIALAREGQELSAELGRGALVVQERRVAIDEGLANFSMLSETEKNALARDIYEDQAERWRAGIEAGATEAEAQRAFDEKMFGKQANLQRQGWHFQKAERLNEQNFQLKLQDRADNLVEAGFTHEAAMAQATREWQTGERNSMQEWEDRKQGIQDALIREGWTEQAARAEAQRQHDIVLLGQQQAHETLERTGSQEYQKQMMELTQVFEAKGMDRADARAEAERQLTMDMAVMGRDERSREFDITTQMTKQQFADTYGLSVQQFQEGQRQFNESMTMTEKQFQDTYGLRRDQFERAKFEFDRLTDQSAKQFAAKHDLDERRFLQANTQVERAMTFEEQRWADQHGFDVDQFHEANRRWQAAFDQSATEFAERLGLERDVFTEGIRRFDENMAMTDEQFQAKFGLSKEQFGEQKRQFDAGLEQRQNEFADSLGLKRETLRTAQDQFRQNFDAARKNAADQFGFNERRFEEANSQFRQQLDLTRQQVADTHSLDVRQFEYAERDGDRRYDMAMTQVTQGMQIERDRFEFVQNESERAFNQREDFFYEGLEDGMKRAKMMGLLQFVNTEAFVQLFQGLPENWDSLSADQRKEWLEQNPSVLKGAEVMTSLMTAMGLEGVEPGDFLDTTADWIESESGGSVDVPIGTTEFDEILVPKGPGPLGKGKRRSNADEEPPPITGTESEGRPKSGGRRGGFD